MEGCVMRKAFLILAPIAFVASLVFYAPVNTATAGDHQFVGVAKCKVCHKKEADGNQFGIWSESGHAKAYETLATEEAKKIGTAVGVDDPQKSDTCLRCHVTGHGAPAEMLGDKYDIADGVGCESCHGAGGDYYKKATMEGVRAGEIDAASVGLIMPTKEVCIECHNDKSPTYVKFDFDEMVKKIAHPIPEKGEGGSK